MEYKVIYHIGEQAGLTTKGLSGRVLLEEDILIVDGPDGLTIPYSAVHQVEIFRQHGGGSLIKLQTSDTCVFVTVPRLNVFGWFAIINYFKTHELFNAIKQRTVA